MNSQIRRFHELQTCRTDLPTKFVAQAPTVDPHVNLDARRADEAYDPAYTSKTETYASRTCVQFQWSTLHERHWSRKPHQRLSARQRPIDMRIARRPTVWPTATCRS